MLRLPRSLSGCRYPAAGPIVGLSSCGRVARAAGDANANHHPQATTHQRGLHTHARRMDAAALNHTHMLFAAAHDAHSHGSTESAGGSAVPAAATATDAAAPAAERTTRRPMSTFQRLSMLFNNLPGPKPAADTESVGRVDSATTVHRTTNLSSASASAFAPTTPIVPSASVASTAAVKAAYATASVVTSLITPQFLVFLRSGSEPDQTPVTAASLLAFARAQGIDWDADGGISARHILVVSGPESHLTRMAGFPCSLAFYVTFPPHETRSNTRVKYMERFVAGGGMQADKVAGWGWRFMRYPSQLQLCTTLGQRSMTAQPSKPMSPRTILSTARATGLPGWDVLDETMVVQQKSTTWMRYSGAAKSPVQYVLRVPPHPRYLQAVADIIRTSAQLREKLGWTAEYNMTNGVLQDVPALPLNKPMTNAATQKPATAAAQAPPAVTAPPAVAASPAAVPLVPSPSTPLVASPSSSRSVVAPTRFWFYVLTSDGRLFLEESQPKRDSTGVRVGLGLKDRKALNVIWSQLRESKEVLTRTGILAAHAQLPVPIPIGSPLGQEAAASFKPRQTTDAQDHSLPASIVPPSPAATLPLSQVLPHYPFLSLCAGELNFIRTEATPIVFKALVPVAPATSRSHGSTSYALQYAGDLSSPFLPGSLCVDATGRLFHPAPAMPSIDGKAASPLAQWGLVSSHLAQELSLRDSPYTPRESSYLALRSEELRRATLEAGEDHQRMIELRPGELVGSKPHEWIGKKVAERMDELGLQKQLSRYALEWQGKTFRIGMIDLPLPLDSSAHI